MTEWTAQKPGVEEWLYWADIVVARLTECVRIYKRPPHHDVFIADADRQRKTDDAIKLLRRIHGFVDQAETPSDSIRDAHSHDEQVIDGLNVLFRETLHTLPWVSEDMQKLLKSPWLSNFPNKQAQELFLGDGDESQGLGSGHIEHGRLPEALFNIIEREKIGEGRHPRKELLRQGEPRRNDVEGRTRWSAQNSRFLRTAGRVE
jgi:hypothetical protein